MENRLWQGTLSCDFFTIPVKLYIAASRREPRFHYLHAQCRTPLEYVRQCPHCGIAVSGADSVRGYEYEDSLVVVSDQDLASLPPTHEPVIVLRQCVHAHSDEAFRLALVLEDAELNSLDEAWFEGLRPTRGSLLQAMLPEEELHIRRVVDAVRAFSTDEVLQRQAAALWSTYERQRQTYSETPGPSEGSKTERGQ
jgi:hypothetical protein